MNLPSSGTEEEEPGFGAMPGFDTAQMRRDESLPTSSKCYGPTRLEGTPTFPELQPRDVNGQKRGHFVMLSSLWLLGHCFPTYRGFLRWPAGQWVAKGLLRTQKFSPHIQRRGSMGYPFSLPLVVLLAEQALALWRKSETR